MSDKVIVTVNEGKVRGIKKTSSFSGVHYYSFLGIPYGQPPMGQARFKDPVKVKPWANNTLDATVDKTGCLQFCLVKKRITGTEDCLYNNIHTTKIPSKGDQLKPVIFVIHPGGLLFGSPDPDNLGSPEFVMHHDIVYVGVSYRLHILGFLDLGLKECSGNQGLKDILMSLQWVKDNIKVFGGDPENITLLGSSSGSSLVHCLMLSPYAKGLFHKAVLMGMYLMNPTLVIPKEHVSLAYELAKSLNYSEIAEIRKDDRKKLLAYYKKMPATLIAALRPETVFRKDNPTLFPASLFSHLFEKGENSILPLSLKELAPSTARVPLLIGFCDKEAAMTFVPKFRTAIMKNFYQTLVQNPWGWGYNLTAEQLKEIQKQTEIFYLNGDSVDDATITMKCNIQTDIALSDVYDSVINVIAADLPSSVYVYKFDYEGSIGTLKQRVLEQVDEPLKGTIHGCDYSYFAYMREYATGNKCTVSPRSRKTVETFTKLICTFARTGNPNYEDLNVHWSPSTVENPSYLSIDEELQLIDGKLNGERMEFWENLKRQFTQS